MVKANKSAHTLKFSVLDLDFQVFTSTLTAASDVQQHEVDKLTDTGYKIQCSGCTFLQLENVKNHLQQREI